VRQSAAIDADRAGQHQGHDGGAIEQVVVVPVVGPRADDDQVLAARLLCVKDPFPRIAETRVPMDAGVLLLPGRGVASVVIVGRRIGAGELATHAELRHQQVEDGRHRYEAGAGLDGPHGHTAQLRPAAGEVVKRHLRDRVVLREER